MAAGSIGLRLKVLDITEVFVTDDIHMAHFRPPAKAPAPYANAVALVDVPRPPLAAASPACMALLMKGLEREIGRDPRHKDTGLVNIDIDLVTACGLILRPVDFMRGYYFPRVLEIG